MTPHYNKQLSDTKIRENYLDTVAGILLIYMICVHSSQTADIWPVFDKYTYWLGFFMPWFFFKGGAFYHPKSTKDLIHNSYRRLLIPFIYFTLIGCVILWIGLALKGSFSLKCIIHSICVLLLNGSSDGNLPLWFLTTLFAVRIIFNYFYIKIKNCESNSAKILWGVVFTTLCLIFIPFHYLINHLGISHYPVYISNISSGLAFYTCGYLLRNVKLNKKITAILLLAYIIAEIYLPIHVDMRSGQSVSGLYILWIPFCLLCIMTYNNIFYNFINKKNLLTRIGSDTLPYYCMHKCVIGLASIPFIFFDISNSIKFIILITANIILLPTLIYLIRRTRYRYILG
jgi:fucose 4-O-acetylase-like acetyltransferase